MSNIWDHVRELYPDVDINMKEIKDKLVSIFGEMEEFEESHPVEGYDWEIDPNNIEYGYNLKPSHILDDAIDKANMRLEKQHECVSGTHHFIPIASHIKWCTYCGTIKKDYNLIYPENPHFLPKSKEE